MKLTYEQGREMSIWRWKNFPTGFPDDDDWMASPFAEIYDGNNGIRSGCGMCEFFLTGKTGLDEENCKMCPLHWKDAHEEERSDFDDRWCHLKCSHNYWHWSYWYEEKVNPERMRYWAKKMLAEIEATPEHLE